MKFALKFVMLTVALQCALLSGAIRRRAWIRRPVVNMISAHPDEVSGYEFFVTAYAPSLGPGCFRTFQGLFGEVVLVDGQRSSDGHWIRAEVLNCFFADRRSGKQPLAYWVRADDLCFLDELSDAEQALFPEPISHQKPASLDAPGVVTLALPWTCRENGRTYSAGTRFLACGRFERHLRLRMVAFFDPERCERIEAAIPTRLLVYRGARIPPAQKRRVFLQLLKKWCATAAGVVPYVWGGASFCERLPDEHFSRCQRVNGGRDVSFWIRDGGSTQTSGFDCSALVLRAAQASGIPYFCRTSGTAAGALVPVTAGDTLQPGDLLVTDGHNHILVATGKNGLIEAAGYVSGFGRVQETTVEQRFMNAMDYDDLIRLVSKREVPIYRCKNGSPMTPSSLSIVRLPIH